MAPRSGRATAARGIAAESLKASGAKPHEATESESAKRSSVLTASDASVQPFYGQLKMLDGNVLSLAPDTSVGSRQKNVVLSLLEIRNSRPRPPAPDVSGSAISRRHMRVERGGTAPRIEKPAEVRSRVVMP